MANVEAVEADAAKQADLANLVNLLGVFSAAANGLQALEASINEQLMNLIDEHQKDYAQLQEAMTKAETACEALTLMHPEWFKVKRSIRTPYGTVKFHSGTKLLVENPEGTILLLRAEKKADPKFKAEEFIRSAEEPNLEMLERLDDETLARFQVRRVRADKFSVEAAKLDMGKAVKEAAEAKG